MPTITFQMSAMTRANFVQRSRVLRLLAVVCEEGRDGGGGEAATTSILACGDLTTNGGGPDAGVGDFFLNQPPLECVCVHIDKRGPDDTL